ncbi:hypothetical protein K1719_007060 [Acacia pycnantha]|nr:hypothetical protein K1719_007060 [Acacia pycnantha]
MLTGVYRKIPSGLLKPASAIMCGGFLAWAFLAIRPPPPNICGSVDGPPITAPRIKLRDGRHLAYKEHGVPKDEAKHKIIYVHGFDNCRHDAVVANTLSPEITESLGVYIVSFDRPGYGESDPDPNRTVKSLVVDIEELADQLQLGARFYVIGFSMGGQVIWSCLKYIPHRLAGAALLAPVINYWWPGLPANLTKEVYSQKTLQDQWALRASHYFPWLTYLWFHASSTSARSPDKLSRQDRELISKMADRTNYVAQVRQQGEHESLHRDIIIGMGKWEFSPTDLENPFPNNEGSVHLWQGDEDVPVPVKLQRYIAQKLPWIQYHEIPGAGHLFPLADGMSDAIVKSLISGKEASI